MAIGTLQDGARKALREINNQETAWAVIDASNVSTIKDQILNAQDRVRDFLYADFGTKNERIIQIDYSSATVNPGQTARRIFVYTLVGTKYRLDSDYWVIV